MRSASSEVDAAAERAHSAALLGDFSATLALLRDAGETDSGWLSCLRELCWLAGAAPSLPSLESLADAAKHDPGNGIVLACGHRVLSSVLQFDLDAVAWLADVSARAARTETDALWVRRNRMWRAILAGRSASAEEAAELGRDAARASVASLAVEGTVLAALSALEAGELDAATASARRGVRMARAEAIVQLEYLASVVLARIRRASGHGHLAARILVALERVLPPSWARWLHWEMGFAGAGSENTPVALALRGILSRALSGNRDELGGALQTLREIAGSSAFAIRDAVGLAEAIDPSLAPDVSIAWSQGQHDRTRAPIESRWGICDPLPPVFVLAGPTNPARRVLASGLALVPPPSSGEADVLRVDHSVRRDARVLHLLVVLAHGGPAGAEEETVFREVYGFNYVRNKHDGVFRVLVHRARAQVEGHADVTRDQGRVALVPRAGLLLPDPRCSRSVEERVMHHLGTTAGAESARAVADALGLNLRAAQRALRKLAEDGACTSESQGRAALYRLEDTTFLEPTRSRVAAGPT